MSVLTQPCVGCVCVCFHFLWMSIWTPAGCGVCVLFTQFQCLGTSVHSYPSSAWCLCSASTLALPLLSSDPQLSKWISLSHGKISLSFSLAVAEACAHQIPKLPPWCASGPGRCLLSCHCALNSQVSLSQATLPSCKSKAKPRQKKE